MRDGTDLALAFETPDSQASITAEVPALGLAAAETAVDGELVPLDPTAYGDLPDGQGQSGNVYRLTVTARPSGRAITSFARPVSLSLRIANNQGGRLYTSPDGRTWTSVVATVHDPFVAANVRAPGYFVLGGPADQLPVLPRRDTSTGASSVFWIGALVALAVAAAVAVLLRRKARPAT